MKYDNLSFQEALQQLADRAGVKLPEADQSEKSKKRQEEREQLLAVNKEAATYYFRLLRSPRGKKGPERAWKSENISCRRITGQKSFLTPYGESTKTPPYTAALCSAP